MNQTTNILDKAKKACLSLWNDRDIFKFQSYCHENINITGFCSSDCVNNENMYFANIFSFLQDTSISLLVSDEKYTVTYEDEYMAVVLCDFDFSLKRLNIENNCTVKVTFVFTFANGTPQIVNAHFSSLYNENEFLEDLLKPRKNDVTENEIEKLSLYYRELITNNCDLFIELDSDEYVLYYDKQAYQNLFEDDTYFTNPDRWFWNMCNACVHPEDYEQLDIFRKIDIDKRIRNNINKLERTFRIRNKAQGYIWVKLSLIATIDSGELKKVALIFTKLERSQFNELEFLENSRRDKLTSLYNKSYFEYLANMNLRSFIPSTMPALALIDIDNFRLVNDTFGHLTGDLILTQFSRSLYSFFGQDSVIGRIKGDKFAVLIKNLPNRYEVTKSIDNFLKSIHHIHYELGTSLDIHCSAGITFIDESCTDITSLIDKSSSALAIAKDKGKNCYVIYDTSNENK